METNQSINEKRNFLKNDLVKLFKTLNADDKGQWGVLNAQQMVEHLSDAFRNYHGYDSEKLVTPAEHLPRMREFMLSEKQFKPNTKNAEMPEVPVPVKHPDMQTALTELQTEINNFLSHFEADSNRTIINLFFGKLNFDESVHLLHKHSMHHLRQFNLVA